MDLVKEYKEKSTFKNEQAFFESLTHVFMFGTIESENTSAKTIQNKEEMNSLIINLLEKILSNNIATSRKDKLTIINLLDELNFRNEILHQIATKNLSQDINLKEASNSLGKKFMSSVKK